MVKLVDRYVGSAAVLGMLLVWCAMTMLFLIFNLLDELRSTQNNYGTNDAFWFTALTIPRMAYQVFPVSALLGALVGVGGLAAGNELVAFRTAGISRVRLALAALAGTVLLMIPVMIMGEWLAPAAEQQARAYRLSELVGQPIIGGPRGMWMIMLLPSGKTAVSGAASRAYSFRAKGSSMTRMISTAELALSRRLRNSTRCSRKLNSWSLGIVIRIAWFFSRSRFHGIEIPD